MTRQLNELKRDAECDQHEKKDCEHERENERNKLREFMRLKVEKDENTKNK